MKTWARLKALIVNRILGLNDTPQRIAWGVLLGFVVAFSPTVGFQMLIYVALATLLRANKVSGIPVVWLTNPLTIVPIYYACWWVGATLLGSGNDAERGQAIIGQLLGVDNDWSFSLLLQSSFWQSLGRTFVALGAELWLGGFVVGVALGGLFYPITLFSVNAYRRARGR